VTRRSLDELGSLQRAIMDALWQQGEATVHQVRDQLGRKPKPAYTTVLSAMQKLERLGWLQHRADGRTYIYQPTRSLEQESSRSIRTFVKRVFAGNSLAAFQHLIEDRKLSDGDLAELKRMIDRRKKEQENG